MALKSLRQEEIQEDLKAMIKALEYFKQSRPPVQLVKTGVSTAALPQFLVSRDIVSEQKRMHTPSPMGAGILKAGRPVITGPVVTTTTKLCRKKTLKKSLKLKKLKVEQIQKTKENKRKQSNLHSGKAPKKRAVTQRHTGIWKWLEGIAIKMSKTSLLGLFFVLLLLGGVFFGVGFLTAITNIKQGSAATMQSWQQASQNQGQSQSGGKANPVLAAMGTMASSVIAHKVNTIESKLGGGVLNKAVEQVPDTLKPFAMHMQNKLSQRSQGIVDAGGRAVQHAFKPSRFGTTPPPSVQYTAPVMTGVTVAQSTFDQPMNHEQAAQPIESMRSYAPSQQAFRQASIMQNSAVRHPPARPMNGYQNYPQPVGRPSAPMSQAGYEQATAPVQVPAVVMQSQPYGVSQPYGYPQGQVEQPKMIGMG